MGATFNRISVGIVGNKPGLVQMYTADALSIVTAAGYASNSPDMSIQLGPTDVLFGIYGSNPTFGIFIPSFSNGIVTLNLTNGGSLLPTIVDHIATYSNTSGGLKEDSGTAINGGNLQAGKSGTAGYLTSFPSTAAKGSFRWQGTANTGDTITTVTNAAMGQASVITLPDPGASTANLLLAPAALVNGNIVKASGTSGLTADAGFSLHAGTSPISAGGGPDLLITAPVTTSYLAFASIVSYTNIVTINKVFCNTGNIQVVFSADPGANTVVNWLAISGSVT